MFCSIQSMTTTETDDFDSWLCRRNPDRNRAGWSGRTLPQADVAALIGCFRISVLGSLGELRAHKEDRDLYPEGEVDGIGFRSRLRTQQRAIGQHRGLNTSLQGKIRSLFRIVVPEDLLVSAVVSAFRSSLNDGGRVRVFAEFHNLAAT